MLSFTYIGEHVAEDPLGVVLDGEELLFQVIRHLPKLHVALLEQVLLHFVELYEPFLIPLLGLVSEMLDLLQGPLLLS